MRIVFFLLILPVIFQGRLQAQCTNFIATFPFVENFETSNGNWTTGGTASDWAYGSPNKQYINSAASGTKCWIAGGLTSGPYNNGENSWLMSPCFDFSNLSSPLIRFSIFWETENRWDGASMEYTLNNGNTWIKAGRAADSNFCYTKNWFNHAFINGVGEGWSGSIKATSGSCLGGGGRGQWLTAQHQFLNLAGQPSVRFRFTFTAGTTCNNFDGFAIDDFSVLNTPVPSSNYTYSCNSNNSLTFTANTTYCNPIYSWDFGDPLSGSNNFSQSPTPTHVFTQPGVYTVVLTTSNGQSVASSFTSTIVVIEATALVTDSILCNNGNNGVAIANAIGSPTPYQYLWNTSPPQASATASGLKAGMYTVEVTSANACPDTATVTLVNPSPISYTVTEKNATCGLPNGEASIAVSGGTMPYSYSWTPLVSSGSTASNLSPGSYSIIIKDKNFCTDTAVIQIDDIALNINFSNVSHVTCFGETNGSATAIASGGAGNYTYSWSPSGGTNASATGLGAGTYIVTATDVNGCSGSKSINIFQPAKLNTVVSATATSCGKNNGSARVIANGGTPAYNYLWTPGGLTTETISNLQPGKYNVQITDEVGCVKEDSVKILASANPVIGTSSKVDVSCNGASTGEASATVSGGVMPYSYRWTNGSQVYNTPVIKMVPAGTYTIKVSDSTGCIDSTFVTIDEPSPITINISATNTTCNLNNGSANTVVAGGIAPYTYSWSAGATSPSIANVAAGLYSLTISDANNCIATANHTIGASSVLKVFLGNDTTLCPGSNLLLRPGPFASYRWQNNSSASSIEVSSAGSYFVTVTSAEGCTASDTIIVTEDCRDIVFPSAFTPNRDGKNDYFKPLGTISAISNYRLIIFNRWGHKVFESTNPFEPWEGTLKGLDQGSQVFAWVAEFVFNHQPKKIMKGTVVLLK